MAAPFVAENADGETRTRKAKPHAPQACAYTNSATSAFIIQESTIAQKNKDSEKILKFHKSYQKFEWK